MGKFNRLQTLITEGYAVPKIFMHIKNLRTSLVNISFVEDLYQLLKNHEVILRSDAATEDEQISHAGLYDSFRINASSSAELNKQLVEVADKSTNQSFFIQAFISSEQSGVIFSRNPISLWDKNGLIEIGEESEQVTRGEKETKKLTFQESPGTIFEDLVKTTKEIERKINFPVDIEWAYSEKKFWILQVRPIQTDGKSLSFYERRWTRKIADERFPKPMTPLGWDLMENVLPINLAMLEAVLGLQTSKELPTTLYKNYVYIDPEYFQFQRIRFKFSWLFNSGALFRVLYFLLGMPKLWLQGRPLMLSFVQSFYGPQIRKLISSWSGISKSSRKELSLVRDRIKDQKLTVDLFLQLEKCCFDFFAPDILVYALKMAYFESLKKNVSERRLQEILLLPEHPRKKFHLKIVEYHQSPSQEKLSALVRDYGHLRLDWDISRPAFHEQSNSFEFPLQPISSNPTDEHLQLSADEKEFVDLVLIDEEMQFYSSEFLLVCKEFFVKLANENGIPSEEIYFYKLSEIKLVLTQGTVLSPHLIQARRRFFQQSEHDTPEYTLPSHAHFSEKNSSYSPVSSGSAEGPLFILHDISLLHQIPKDCILHTHYPHPLLMTIYSQIRGLACVSGGPLAHGFISAREFHLPAITGVAPFENQNNGRRIRIHSHNGSFEWL